MSQSQDMSRRIAQLQAAQQMAYKNNAAPNWQVPPGAGTGGAIQQEQQRQLMVQQQQQLYFRMQQQQQQQQFLQQQQQQQLQMQQQQQTQTQPQSKAAKGPKVQTKGTNVRQGAASQAASQGSQQATQKQPQPQQNQLTQQGKFLLQEQFLKKAQLQQQQLLEKHQAQIRQMNEQHKQEFEILKQKASSENMTSTQFQKVQNDLLVDLKKKQHDLLAKQTQQRQHFQARLLQVHQQLQNVVTTPTTPQQGPVVNMGVQNMQVNKSANTAAFSGMNNAGVIGGGVKYTAAQLAHIANLQRQQSASGSAAPAQATSNMSQQQQLNIQQALRIRQLQMQQQKRSSIDESSGQSVSYVQKLTQEQQLALAMRSKQQQQQQPEASSAALAQAAQRQYRISAVQEQIEKKLKATCATVQDEIKMLESYLNKLVGANQQQGRMLVQQMLMLKKQQLQANSSLNPSQQPTAQPNLQSIIGSANQVQGFQKSPNLIGVSPIAQNIPNPLTSQKASSNGGLLNQTPELDPTNVPKVKTGKNKRRPSANNPKKAAVNAMSPVVQSTSTVVPSPVEPSKKTATSPAGTTKVASTPVSTLVPSTMPPKVPVIPDSLKVRTTGAPTKLTKPQQHLLKDLIASYGSVTQNTPISTKLFENFERQLKKIGDTIRKNEDKRRSTKAAHNFNAPTIERIKSLSTPAVSDVTLIRKPSKTVLGDKKYLLKTKESILETRMKWRTNILAEIRNRPSITGAALPVVMEHRALSLLGFQRETRLKVIAYEAQAKDGRVPYKQMQRDNLNMEKQINKLMNKIHKGTEDGLKRQEQKKLRILSEHQKDFTKFHSRVRAKLKEISHAVVRYFENKITEEQRQQAKLEKERMALLRMNDEEGYRKLIDDQKDGRLKHLLDKTDEYMASMALLIADHQQEETKQAKRRNSELTGEGSVVSKSTSGGLKQPEAITESQKKFGTAHKIGEKIESQPRMLQFGKLKEYQVQGLEWLVSLYNNQLNGILADEMGLGKTIQSLSYLAYLIEKKGVDGPYLIIVPNSVLSNWVNEIERWVPNLIYVPYRGPKPKRKSWHDQIKAGRFNVLLTTYEFVMADKAILGKVSWASMIVDEGHRLKNKDGKLGKILAKYYTAPRRLLLSGTPLQNSLPELWALLNFLLPEIFKSAENFDEWFAKPFAATGERVELSEEERMLIIQRLHKVLRPFLLRRLKKDVMQELPQKVVHVLKCEMSAMQKRLYHHLKTHGVILQPAEEQESIKPGDNRGNVTYLNNTIMQLRKICNHPFLFQSVDKGMVKHLGLTGPNGPPEVVNTDDLWRCCGKFELLDRVLFKLFRGGHRVLLFSQMVELLTVLEDYCVLKQVKYLKLDGSTKSEERGELIRLFNADDSPYQLFILSTRAGGLGLNLQSADSVIIYDSDWNPHQDLQAQDRAHRIGQKHEVRVFRFVTVNSVEESIFETAQDKLQMDAQVIQAGKFNQNSSQQERQEFLRKLLEAGEDDENDEEESRIPDAEQMNRYLARGEEEYQLFCNLDKEIADLDDRTWKSEAKVSRLMTQAELPDWMRRSDGDVKWQATANDRIDINLGRGTRTTKDVDYTHEIRFSSDEDADGTSRRGRKRRRKHVEHLEPDEFTILGKRSKTRDRPTAAPPRPGAGNVTIDSSIKEQVLWLLRIVANYRIDGRKVAENYILLPPKQQLPMYYVTVQRPIAIKQMRRKAEKYENLDQLSADMDLMIANSRQFNEEGSSIVRDAEILLEVFRKERKSRFGQDTIDTLEPGDSHGSSIVDLVAGGGEADKSFKVEENGTSSVVDALGHADVPIPMTLSDTRIDDTLIMSSLADSSNGSLVDSNGGNMNDIFTSTDSKLLDNNDNDDVPTVMLNFPDPTNV